MNDERRRSRKTWKKVVKTSYGWIQQVNSKLIAGKRENGRNKCMENCMHNHAHVSSSSSGSSRGVLRRLIKWWKLLQSRSTRFLFKVLYFHNFYCSYNCQRVGFKGEACVGTYLILLLVVRLLHFLIPFLYILLTSKHKVYSRWILFLSF